MWDSDTHDGDLGLQMVEFEFESESGASSLASSQCVEVYTAVWSTDAGLGGLRRNSTFELYRDRYFGGVVADFTRSSLSESGIR